MQIDKFKIHFKGEDTSIPNKSDVMGFNAINHDSTFLILKSPTSNTFSFKSYIWRSFGEHATLQTQKNEEKNFFLSPY